MAFSDPQSLTIGGTTFSVARAYTGTRTGQFVSADGIASLEIVPPSPTGSRRHSIARLRHRKVAADPLTQVNTRVGALITLNVNRPLNGYTDAEVKDLAQSLITWATASSGANLVKLIAGEN